MESVCGGLQLAGNVSQNNGRRDGVENSGPRHCFFICDAGGVTRFRSISPISLTEMALVASAKLLAEPKYLLAILDFGDSKLH
jgi:hypothetical protein